MIFSRAPIEGVFLIEPDAAEDERGSFARVWCEREALAHGLTPRMVQASVSRNRRRGTLRGLHHQAPPEEEAKLVRCIRGRIHDVVLDLRPHSPTFTNHAAFTLSDENRVCLYVPEGCAHGFQTLEDDTEVLYLISAFYSPAAAQGVRWNDPAFAIPWPLADPIVSARDRSFPDFTLRRGTGDSR